MAIWRKLADRIDRLNEGIGRLVCWLTLAMVLIAAFNALIGFMAPTWGSNVYRELQWYLFSVVFLIGAAYTLKHDAHVRVDVLYGRISPKGRAWIDLLGTLLFMLPFCALMLWTTWPAVRDSWKVREMSPDPGGLPRYPIKALIPIALALLILQGIAWVIQKIVFLRSGVANGAPSQTPEPGGHL